jgi:hypothetical protein
MAPSSIVSFNPRAVSNYTTCSTSECVKTAQSILDDIDLNVDPCSDFYQYTCNYVHLKYLSYKLTYEYRRWQLVK